MYTYNDVLSKDVETALMAIAMAEQNYREKAIARAEEERDFFRKLGLEYSFIGGQKLA